jgi:hypothetical protein
MQRLSFKIILQNKQNMKPIYTFILFFTLKFLDSRLKYNSSSTILKINTKEETIVNEPKEICNSFYNYSVEQIK